MREGILLYDKEGREIWACANVDARSDAEVGQLIAATVFNAADEAKLADVRRRVNALLDAHPLYPGLEY